MENEENDFWEWNDGYKKGEKNMQDFVECRCRELGIDYTLIFTCNNADN